MCTQKSILNTRISPFVDKFFAGDAQLFYYLIALTKLYSTLLVIKLNVNFTISE